MKAKNRKTYMRQRANERRKAEYAERSHFKCPRCKGDELEVYQRPEWGKAKRCAKCKTELWKLKAMEQSNES